MDSEFAGIIFNHNLMCDYFGYDSKNQMADDINNLSLTSMNILNSDTIKEKYNINMDVSTTKLAKNIKRILGDNYFTKLNNTPSDTMLIYYYLTIGGYDGYLSSQINNKNLSIITSLMVISLLLVIIFEVLYKKHITPNYKSILIMLISISSLLIIFGLCIFIFKNFSYYNSFKLLNTFGIVTIPKYIISSIVTLVVFIVTNNLVNKKN